MGSVHSATLLAHNTLTTPYAIMSATIPLGPGPVILTLGSWLQQHLQEVYQATTQQDFQSALEAFVAPHATIVLNGKKVSRSEYMQQVWGEPSAQQTSAQLVFNDTVEVPTDPKAIVQV